MSLIVRAVPAGMVLSLQPEEAIAEYGPSVERLAVAALAFVVVWLLGRYVAVPAVMRVIQARNQENRTMVQAIRRYTTLLAFLIAAAVATAVAGYGDLLAGSALFVAALTVAVGVAGQEVIGNLVSGLFLVADPEFNVDDWIAWDEGEGTVEAIRFRVTRVRTPNNEVITVPNTTLATNAVRRPYSRDQFRVTVRVGVSHEEDIDRGRAVLREGFEGLDGVLDRPRPEVVIDEFGEDALWLRAQFWIGDPTRVDAREARSRYVERVHERLRAEGVAFSPPSDHQLSGELEVTGPAQPTTGDAPSS